MPPAPLSAVGRYASTPCAGLNRRPATPRFCGALPHTPLGEPVPPDPLRCLRIAWECCTLHTTNYGPKSLAKTGVKESVVVSLPS